MFKSFSFALNTWQTLVVLGLVLTSAYGLGHLQGQNYVKHNTQLTVLERALDAAKGDQQAAAENAVIFLDLTAQVKDLERYITQLENDNECLDNNDIVRLRDLWDESGAPVNAVTK